MFHIKEFHWKEFGAGAYFFLSKLCSHRVIFYEFNVSQGVNLSFIKSAKYNFS